MVSSDASCQFAVSGRCSDWTTRKSVDYRAPPPKYGDMGSTLNLQPSKCKTNLRTLLFLRRVRERRPDARGLRPMRTSPLKWSGQHLILRRVLEQSVQMLPVGSPFQDVVLTAQLLVNSETSLERLVPLVDFTLVHFCQYISLGPADYRKSISIQFGSRLPRFRGVFSTEVPPPSGSGNGTRSESSVREKGHRICTSLQQENQVYSQYFIVPKKDGGLRPILDLQVRNDSVMQLKFKMLTLRQILPEIRSEDWFVTIDLKDAYFHISILPCHRRFQRFAFGGKAYQYRVLLYGLALSPRTFTKCVDAALVPFRL